MKKILALIPVLMMVAGACSDDDGPVSPSDLPENDLNISVPVIPASWAPGMVYKPYADNLPVALGVKVNVLVVGEGKTGEREMNVLNNEAWIWGFDKWGKPVMQKENVKLCYFPNHEDIHIGITESEKDFNPDGVECDIVMVGFPVERMSEAQRNMKQLVEKFTDYPLVVVPGGDYDTPFSQKAWNLCVRIGGLDWKKNVLPHFPDWEIGEELTEEQKVYYHPGHVGAAYAVERVDGYDYVADWIVVGRRDGKGNLPGPILKDRWICAPYSFNVDDSQVTGTALGAAYVAKIAAEIKRRLPHYTNAEIANLIFEQADDLGDSEIYGHGMINPKKIWNAVENIEAQSDNNQE
ncbi:MAG: hypothetical protein RR397_10710 [Odoribacter sp.]